MVQVEKESLLDPVIIFLKQIGFYQNLTSLDSDFRVIYFSKVLQGKTEKESKYLVCFYTKMDGYIKYLGIEFLYFFSESQPLFIENMYLVQNLDLLQTLMGISEGINFQFY